MSRTWMTRVPLTLFLSDSEKAEHGRLTFKFDLVEITAPERMLELLKQALFAAGWQPEARPTAGGETQEILSKCEANGARLTADLQNGTVEVDVSGQYRDGIEVDVYDHYDAMQVDAQITSPQQLDNLGITDMIRSQLNHINDRMSENMMREALQAKLALNQALHQVYRDALKEKAASLGSIVSINESDQQGELRIRIELV